ncbi:MFS transporter, partial [bacterium]|nr:MFS transporter [bacterium]
RRGDLRMLFWPPKRFLRFLSCVGIGVPIWFMVGVILMFAPEFAKVLQIQGKVTAGYAILFGYAGLSIGDILTGVLSQKVRSRKKVVLGALLTLLVLVYATLLSRGMTSQVFYTYCLLLGIAGGYWALFVTVAAEQVGTNIRSLVAISAPNFVRGSVAIITSAFSFGVPSMGLVGSALTVGTVTIALGLLSLHALEETFGKDLNYVER